MAREKVLVRRTIVRPRRNSVRKLSGLAFTDQRKGRRRAGGSVSAIRNDTSACIAIEAQETYLTRSIVVRTAETSFFQGQKITETVLRHSKNSNFRPFSIGSSHFSVQTGAQNRATTLSDSERSRYQGNRELSCSSAPWSQQHGTSLVCKMTVRTLP